MRFMLVGIGLVLTVSGCGGDEMSLTEYVDGLNVISEQARTQSEAVTVQYWQTAEPTANDIKTYLEGVIAVATETLEVARALDPPAQVADVHDLLFGRHSGRMLVAAEELADRAANSTDVDQVLQSAEADAYFAALVEGSAACEEFQVNLDATEARGAFADTPWVPAEMKEIVQAFLGCDVYPESLEDMFITPPTTAP
jgi:hypothetical protein